MSELYISPYSVSIAQKIVKDYFQTVMGHRSDVLMYYAHDAYLQWDGKDYHGHGEIQSFFEQLPAQVTFYITGFDVQSVSETDLLTMLVVFGSYQMPGARMQDFHCSFFIQSHNENALAIFKSQCFSCF